MALRPLLRYSPGPSTSTADKSGSQSRPVAVAECATPFGRSLPTWLVPLETTSTMPKACRGIGRIASARHGADDQFAQFVHELSCPRPGAAGGHWAAAQHPHPSAPARGRLAAIRFQARALVLALGVAATANGQAVRPEPDGAGSGRVRAPFVRTGVAIHHGQELHYEIIDGLAVHGGDMVLGSVEDGGRRAPKTAPNEGRDGLPAGTTGPRVGRGRISLA